MLHVGGGEVYGGGCLWLLYYGAAIGDCVRAFETRLTKVLITLAGGAKHESFNVGLARTPRLRRLIKAPKRKEHHNVSILRFQVVILTFGYPIQRVFFVQVWLLNNLPAFCFFPSYDGLFEGNPYLGQLLD